MEKIFKTVIDENYKITLPFEIIQQTGISKFDIVEIFFKNETIYIRKEQENCIICVTFLN